MNQLQHKVVVIGHKNPDTDSICAAICYAELKNRTGEMVCEARRQGHLSRETEYVLNRFGVEPPRFCADVYPKVRDVDFRRAIPDVSAETSVRAAWTKMQEVDLDTMPIVDTDGQLLGLISVNDLAKAGMDVMDSGILAKSRTTYRNILDTLGGTLLVGNPDTEITTGHISIGAGSAESMDSAIEAGDIVITANRLESQLTCIEKQAGLVICCLSDTVGRTVLHLAREQGTAVMVVPCDTYAAAKLISQCVPVSYYMTREEIVKFSTLTPISDVEKVMGKVRHRYFPVLDEDGRFAGLISRRNVLNRERRRLILVDHNETSQTVEGYEEAEVLEIIDHHRVADLQTSGPVYFRNQPVGCTCTIVAQMYREAGQEITPAMAGLMLGAILSDTLDFRSPTCTHADRTIAKELAGIAGVDMEQFAAEMFAAGENLTGKTAEDLLTQDYKVFLCGDHRFGVAQCSYMTDANREQAERLLQTYLAEARARLNVEDLYVLLTDIPDQCSTVLSIGPNCREVLTEAFSVTPDPAGIGVLPGVISRKKQFLPRLMDAYQQL